MASMEDEYPIKFYYPLSQLASNGGIPYFLPAKNSLSYIL